MNNDNLWISTKDRLPITMKESQDYIDNPFRHLIDIPDDNPLYSSEPVLIYITDEAVKKIFPRTYQFRGNAYVATFSFMPEADLDGNGIKEITNPNERYCWFLDHEYINCLSFDDVIAWTPLPPAPERQLNLNKGMVEASVIRLQNNNIEMSDNEQNINISAALAEKIVDFCKNELQYHIHESRCSEEYKEESETQIELLKLLGHSELAEKYDEELKQSLEDEIDP